MSLYENINSRETVKLAAHFFSALSSNYKILFFSDYTAKASLSNKAGQPVCSLRDRTQGSFQSVATALSSLLSLHAQAQLKATQISM